MFRKKALNISRTILKFFTEQGFSFIRENSKLLAQAIITILSIGFAIWFISNERNALSDVRGVLNTAQWQLVLLGIGLTIVYILLQGMMYVASFASIKHKINLWSAVILFLKRNLISVFLPAGGVSSLAFFTGDIED